MKISQLQIDEAFLTKRGFSGYYVRDDLDDECEKIKQVISTKFSVILSTSEAFEFWKWRCAQWDGTWFRIANDSEIIDFFEKFLKEFFPRIDED